MSLIRLTHALPELEYQFRHALVQDAAYASLLKQDRKRLHQAVGETLERLYPQRREELAAVLAEHFHQAGDEARAFEYFSLAGDHAMQHYALPEAVAHYTRAIEIGPEQTVLSPRLYSARGSAYETLGDFERARSDYETALHRAQRAGDGHAQWQALLDLGLLWAGRDYVQTRLHYERAFELAHSMGDPRAIAHSMNRMGNLHMNVEQPLQALHYHQQALATFKTLQDMPSIAETLDLLGLASFTAVKISDGVTYYRQAIELFHELNDRRGLSSSLAILGFRRATVCPAVDVAPEGVAETLRDAEQALQCAREVGWRAGEAFALYSIGMCLGMQGGYAQALDTVRAGYAIAEAIEHHQWMTCGNMILGMLYLDLFALPEAQRCLEKAHEIASHIGSLYWIRNTATQLALAYVLQRHLERAERVLDAALGLDAPAETMAQYQVWYARAESALASGDPVRALEITNMLSVPAQGQANVRPALHILRLRGEALIALRQYMAAEAELKTAHDIAVELGARPMQWRILLSLNQAYQGQGKDEEARQAISAARMILLELAPQTPEGQLRDNLLNRAAALVPSL